MTRLVALLIGAVMVAGCAAAPAPTPEVIEKVVQAPAPTPTVITKTVPVTPKVCLDALDAADEVRSLLVDASIAALDGDFTVLDAMLNDAGTGTLQRANDTYNGLRDECRYNAEVGS